jgi:hypothetical protein
MSDSTDSKMDFDAPASAVSLFSADRTVHSTEHDVIHVRVNQMRLWHPRQWGACWRVEGSLAKIG